LLAAKRVADVLTLARAFIAVILAWLGCFTNEESLTAAVWLLIASWTTDLLDGRFARMSAVRYRTWIGDHDLQVDMAVSGGVLVYLIGSGFVEIWFVAFYLFISGLIFLRWGFLRPLGMLFQAPIYGGFIWKAVLKYPGVGLWMVLWVVAAVAITWPQLPKQVIPEFLAGMKRMFERGSRK
jgi:phosphatidylglycerophosphate synthase